MTKVTQPTVNLVNNFISFEKHMSNILIVLG